MRNLKKLKFVFGLAILLGCSANMPNQSSSPEMAHQKPGYRQESDANFQGRSFAQDPKSYWKQFDNLMFQRKFDQAIRLGTTLLKKFPDYATGYNSRGTAYAITEQHQHALKDFTKAIELNPNEPVFYNNRAASYKYMGQNDLALSDYTQSISLDPSNASSFCGRAEVYRNLRNYDRSLSDLNQAIILDPATASAFYFRGWICHNKGETDKAIDDYSEAIQLDPNIWYYYRDRAGAYYWQGFWNKAMADCNKWITLNSSDSNAFTLRSALYWMMGQYDFASKDANQALTLDSRNVEAYTNRGITNWVQGLKDQAINDLTQGIRANPQASNCYFHLGFFMHETGRRDKAKEYFKKADQINPQIISYRLRFADKNRKLFSKTRQFYEREVDVASKYLGDKEGPVAGSQEQVSLQIHSVSTSSSSVAAGSKFDFRVEYTANDPSSPKNQTVITFSYKISKGTKTLFKSKPVEVESLNGQKMARTVHLSAAKQKGKYMIDVNLKYKGKSVEQMTEFEIQ